MPLKSMKHLLASTLIILLMSGTKVFAQNDHKKIINDYFLEHYKEIGVTMDDVSEWTITDQNYSKQSNHCTKADRKTQHTSNHYLPRRMGIQLKSCRHHKPGYYDGN